MPPLPVHQRPPRAEPPDGPTEAPVHDDRCLTLPEINTPLFQMQTPHNSTILWGLNNKTRSVAFPVETWVFRSGTGGSRSEGGTRWPIRVHASGSRSVGTDGRGRCRESERRGCRDDERAATVTTRRNRHRESTERGSTDIERAPTSREVPERDTGPPANSNLSNITYQSTHPPTSINPPMIRHDTHEDCSGGRSVRRGDVEGLRDPDGDARTSDDGEFVPLRFIFRNRDMSDVGLSECG